MDCNIIRDLLPLYIDACCSEESTVQIEAHLAECTQCKEIYESMKAPCETIRTPDPPTFLHRINDWKASVLQSALLFGSFFVIAVGVSLEGKTPSGLSNSFWALNLVVPVTGFMLSLSNWNFIRLYKSRKLFSVFSTLATFGFTGGAYAWSVVHYEIDLFSLFAGCDAALFFDVLHTIWYLYGIGFALTAVFCVLSGVLSALYAKMLGKQ